MRLLLILPILLITGFTNTLVDDARELTLIGDFAGADVVLSRPEDFGNSQEALLARCRALLAMVLARPADASRHLARARAAEPSGGDRGGCPGLQTNMRSWAHTGVAPGPPTGACSVMRI